MDASKGMVPNGARNLDHEVGVEVDTKAPSVSLNLKLLKHGNPILRNPKC